MLDDLKLIHERDAQDTLGIAEKQWQQLLETYEINTYDGFKPNNVVYAGMGGSALAALVSMSWPGYKIPFQVVRDYDIPAYVGSDTLFIASSYSGNTEETLSALTQAQTARAKIIIIAGGGKLREIAEANAYPLAVLTKTEQPRYAVLANLKALLSAVDSYDILASNYNADDLVRGAEFLKTAVKSWLPAVATKINPAKSLALELIGLSAVIYGGSKMFPAAYKWKISFNENAKQVAWCNQIPEFNHNEFIGWSKQPTDKPYAIIDLRSNLEHERIIKRFEVSERLLSGLRPAPHIVQAMGSDILEQLLWVIAYGDFVTLYVAILNGLNPAPVDLVEKFKTEMNE